MAFLNKAKHAHVDKPCLQFYHINKHGHWFFFKKIPCNEFHYQCFVYGTLGFHDLDFGLLQNIGISLNIRIQQRHLSTRRWIFLWSTYCSYAYRHNLPNRSKRVYVQHARDTQKFYGFISKIGKWFHFLNQNLKINNQKNM